MPDNASASTDPASSRPLPTGWRWVRLGEVLTLRKELIHPKDNPSGEAVFVGLEHIESTTGVRTGSATLDLSHLTGRKPRFYEDDIVYGYLRPYLNKVWLAEFDGLCSVDQYVYYVSRDLADPGFVAWFMRSRVYLSRAPIVTTPGQLPRIRTEEVASVELALPPLPEQRRIAARLQQQLAAVARARAAAQEQVEAAGWLMASYLRELFCSEEARRWPVASLGDAGDIGAGITLGRKTQSGLATRPVPYLRVANVKDGYLDLSDVYEIEATEMEIERCRLQPGDLLLTEGGDPDKLGRGTYWEAQLPECVHQNHIFRVRFDLGRFSPPFVSAQIGSPYGKAYFLAHAKQTTGIATINQRVLAGFPLMTPPLAEQSRAAALIEEAKSRVDILVRSVTQQSAAVDALPAALLRRAFAGEL